MTEPTRLSVMPAAEAATRRALAWARARHPRLAAAVARRPLRWLDHAGVLHGAGITVQLGPPTAFPGRAFACVLSDDAGRPLRTIRVTVPDAACRPARGIRASLRAVEPEGAA